MTFEQFVDLIENERLYFTQILLWEDTHEGEKIRDFFEYLKKLTNTTNDPVVEAQLQPYYELLRKSTYAQSWTHSEIESDALWRIYSSSKTGIRIKVNRIKLVEYINKMLDANGDTYNNFMQGIVEYNKELDYNEYYDNEGKRFEFLKAPMLFYKRQAFKHEEEFRFSFRINHAKMFNTISEQFKGLIINEQVKRYKTDNVVYYNIPNVLIEEVLLDPRAPEYFEQTFIKYCKNRNLKEKQIDFKKSALYSIK